MGRAWILAVAAVVLAAGCGGRGDRAVELEEISNLGCGGNPGAYSCSAMVRLRLEVDPTEVSSVAVELQAEDNPSMALSGAISTGLDVVNELSVGGAAPSCDPSEAVSMDVTFTLWYPDGRTEQELASATEPMACGHPQ